MINKRILIIYHRVDFDGIFSGDIVKLSALDTFNHEPDLIGYNYGDDIPNISILKSYDKVILVDISFPPEYMKQLLEIEMNTPNTIIWIDHHVTAIDNSIKHGYDNLPGLRRNGTAACELTWEYFYQDRPTPAIIQRLGAYDVWDKSRFDWENETLPLQSALRVTYGNGEYYIWPVFEELISKTNDDLEHLYQLGRELNKADAIRFKSDVERFGFPITVAGKYKGIGIMGTSFTSIVFASVLEEYDIYLVINRRRKTVDNETQYFFQLSMYSEPGRIDFNLGQYLQSRFGDAAGGHATAAGAQVSREVFDELLDEGTI